MAGRRWWPGGILGLLDLIDEHRGALEYDFRARFQVGLHIVPEDMGWDEAIRLVRIIRADPSSAFTASAEGWSHPVSRTDAILMDLWDVAAPHTYKKPRPYPRPWKVAAETKRHGDAAGRTPEEVKALLREQFGQPRIA